MSEAVDDSSGGICDACIEFHTILRNRKFKSCLKSSKNKFTKSADLSVFFHDFFSLYFSRESSSISN